jgi:hypothetical protein
MESIYDYTNQAGTVDGRYVRCGHPAGMRCACYGRVHEGEEIAGWPEYQEGLILSSELPLQY